MTNQSTNSTKRKRTSNRIL